MSWLYFFVGVAVGAVVALYIKHATTSPPSNDEAMKQEISDKLDKATEDIKNTI